VLAETPAESALSSKTTSNDDHATTNGAEHEAEDGGDQGGESTNASSYMRYQLCILSSLKPLADSIPKLFSSSQFTFLMSLKPFKSWYDDPARILEKYSTA
jgi:hypothetical protein